MFLVPVPRGDEAGSLWWMPRGAWTSAVQIIRYGGARCGGAGRREDGARNHRAAVESGKGCCLRLALRANVKQGEETKAVGEQLF